MNDPNMRTGAGLPATQAQRRVQERSMPSLDREIDWVLDHPRLSSWLKESLRLSLGRDPLSVLNELEILRCLSERRLALRGFGVARSGEYPGEVIANAGNDAR